MRATGALPRTPGPPEAGSATRLLAGLYDTGRPAGLSEHLARYGPPPRGPVRRGGDARLIELVEASGLLGRGGAGFPAGRKMRTVAAGRSGVVVANGMEGEPAAGKDALLVAVAPHLVLDGVEVAAQAVGAATAHVVVHRGSPAASALRAALAERPVRADLAVSVHELPHHYVASEESALVHWLNGGDGRPVFVPPRPFERGVGGLPTLVNNVETLAHLALIRRYGDAWFRSVGERDEPGTMLVTVGGAVRRPGVVEVGTGTTVADVLEIAGGTTEPVQALLVGGYFGTWLRADLAPTLPLTHAGLRAVGGALGAGIVHALPASVCGLAETAHVLGYLATQNAGQCGPCVNGLPAVAAAFGDLAHGRPGASTTSDLDRWFGVIPGRGACRHPDGTVRLAASALQVFAHDLEQHQRAGPCQASTRPPTLPVGPPVAASWR